MRRFIYIVAFFLLMVFVSHDAFAWGQKGHAIVACIAEKHLTRKAKKNLNAILGGKSLVYYTSWMDFIQNSPYWKNGYDRTKTWHYINIDEGYTPQTMQRNPKGDVLSALNMLIDSLDNHRQELSDSIYRDYTLMLIHLVGDLHCPMHVGRLSDKGGNNFELRWFRQKTNLHTLWDTKLIESVHAWSYTEWQLNIDLCSKSEISQMQSGTVEDWLYETWQITVDIYANVSENVNYSYKYVYDYGPIVEHQLLAAGYRLAGLLNRIFG